MAVDGIASLSKYRDIADLLHVYGVPDMLKNAQEGLKVLETTLTAAQKLTEELLVNVKETDILLNREHVKSLFGVGAADRLLIGTLKLQKELREGDGYGSAGTPARLGRATGSSSVIRNSSAFFTSMSI